MQNTLIIDGSYLGYQAHYAMRGMAENASYDGPRTHIMYAVLARILSLGQQFRTNRMVFCWDSRHSLRRAAFPQYKSGRKRDPSEQASVDEMHRQLRELRQDVLPEIGFFNSFLFKGYEADDIIAAAVRETLDGVSVIVSADEDLFQLLDGRTKIFSPSRHKIITLSGFIQEYRIQPSQWIDVKSIAGCPSDSVPGVGGVAELTAIRFLRGELKKGAKYDSIVSPHGEEIRARNRRLVTLPYEGTPYLSCGSDDLRLDRFDGVCERYGFRSFQSPDRHREWEQLLHGAFSEYIDQRDVKANQRIQSHLLALDDDRPEESESEG